MIRLAPSSLSLLLLLALAGCGRPGAPSVTSSATPPTPANATDFYVLGPGDELQIGVWGQQDMDRTVRVDSAGRINYPFIGSTQAQGLTTEQLRQELTSRLAAYFVDPRVTVSPSELRSLRVHVLGEVRQPGSQVIDRPVTLWEAVAAAGGFSKDADTSEVLLLRDDGEAVRVYAVNLTDGPQSKEGLYPNMALHPGDIVYATPSMLASIEDFMQRFNNIIAPFISVGRAIILWPDVSDILEHGRPVTITPVVSTGVNQAVPPAQGGESWTEPGR